MSVKSGAYLVMQGITRLYFGSGSNQTITIASDITIVCIKRDVSGADLTVGGMTGGEDGRIVFLINQMYTNSVSFVAEEGSNTAANRFAVSFGMDADEARAVIYDGAASRWKLWI